MLNVFSCYIYAHTHIYQALEMAVFKIFRFGCFPRRKMVKIITFYFGYIVFSNGLLTSSNRFTQVVQWNV